MDGSLTKSFKENGEMKNLTDEKEDALGEEELKLLLEQQVKERKKEKAKAKKAIVDKIEVKDDSIEMKEELLEIKENSIEIKQNSIEIKQNSIEIKQNSIKQNSFEIIEKSLIESENNEKTMDVTEIKVKSSEVKEEVLGPVVVKEEVLGPVVVKEEILDQVIEYGQPMEAESSVCSENEPINGIEIIPHQVKEEEIKDEQMEEGELEEEEVVTSSMEEGEIKDDLLDETKEEKQQDKDVEEMINEIRQEVLNADLDQFSIVEKELEMVLKEAQRLVKYQSAEMELQREKLEITTEEKMEEDSPTDEIVADKIEAKMPELFRMYTPQQQEILIVIREGFAKSDAKYIVDKEKAMHFCELNGTLDQFLRDFLLELIESEAVSEKLQELVTLSIEIARKGNSIVSYGIPVILLADIFDLITLDGCEGMFTYLENKVHVWKEDSFFTACKNNLLRLCNDLIKRSPRSTSNVFCGRIQLFLAKFFPFSERSGLNIVSEFNLENITEYGTDNVDPNKTKDNLDKEVDYNLYCKFWALQDFFRNPPQLYDKVQWKTFYNHTNTVLSTLKGIKLEQVADKPDTSFMQKEFFSKYLTSPKLFNLQLYDVSFRRNILVQFLIIFQYLTTTVRFKGDNSLKPDQLDWVNSTVEKVYQLIRDTPPNGVHFATCTKNILKREEYWIKWKNEGCPDFRKSMPSVSANEPIVERKKETRKPLGSIIFQATDKGHIELSDPELTRLWNISTDNLEGCKNKDRDFLPTLDSYFDDAIQQLSNEGGSELIKDGNFGWRGLRLLAKKSPKFFAPNNNQITELHKYLEQMTKNIKAEKDKPGSSTQERPETEVVDLFKQTEDTNEELKNAGDDEVDDNILRFKNFLMAESQFETICQKLVPSWRILAQKLGYKEDEIEFLTTKGKEEIDAVKGLLHLWFDEDDFSTLENFLYILEGLKLDEAAAEVKTAIEGYTKTQTFFNAA